MLREKPFSSSSSYVEVVGYFIARCIFNPAGDEFSVRITRHIDREVLLFRQPKCQNPVVGAAIAGVDRLNQRQLQSGGLYVRLMADI
jgi:hypothetical protein